MRIAYLREIIAAVEAGEPTDSTNRRIAKNLTKIIRNRAQTQVGLLSTVGYDDIYNEELIDSAKNIKTEADRQNHGLYIKYMMFECTPVLEAVLSRLGIVDLPYSFSQ